MSKDTGSTAAEQENNQNTVEDVQDNKLTDTAEIKEIQQEKTFTQSELDKIVSERLARERRNMPDKQSLKEFREWKKSRQSEAEKIAEREAEYQDLKNTAENLRRENLVIKAGVSAEDVDYVLFKVGKMDGEFSQNLSSFLAENKRYTEPKTVKVSGMAHIKQFQQSITKEQFSKMGYRERLKLKNESPEIYNQLKG